MVHIRTYIKRYRLQQGLTQQELANALGVSQAAICMIEDGKRCPSAKLLVRMAKYFRVPVDALLKGA